MKIFRQWDHRLSKSDSLCFCSSYTFCLTLPDIIPFIFCHKGEELQNNIIYNFDTGKKPSEAAEPEKFYHGFVLGLIVELADRYTVTSNRESGYGRYDVVLEPLHKEEDDAVILEFKVYDEEDEETLQDTVQSALTQIEEKQYGLALTAKGLAPGRIRKYGVAFEGKKVLIG